MNISQKNHLRNSFYSLDFDCFAICPDNLAKITSQNCGQYLIKCFDFFKNNLEPNQTENIFTTIMTKIGFLETSPFYQSGLAIAQNLDKGFYFKKDNQYHNLQHTLEVMLTTYHLILIHNAYDESNGFTKDETAIMLLAALIHDLNHDGAGNQGVGFKLEQNAFDTAKDIFTKYNLSQEEQDIIEILVLCTDINYARSLLKRIKKYYAKKIAKPKIPKKFAKFGLFFKTPKVFDMALTLCDADLIPSSALSLEKTKTSSQKIYNEEMKNNYHNNINATKYFLKFAQNILKNGFESKAGSFYNNNLKEIISSLKA